MSNFQIYGGIAEEEFVDVQDQDFVGVHYGTDELDNAIHTDGHIGTTISTTDVQYSKKDQKDVEEQHFGSHDQPEEVYYDGNEGLNGKAIPGTEEYEHQQEEQAFDHQKQQQHEEEDLLEQVKMMMNLEAAQNNGPEWVNSMQETQAAETVVDDEVELPVMEVAENGEVQVPDTIVIHGPPDEGEEVEGQEDPPTPTAIVPPTSPKTTAAARPLSETLVMAAETQYPVPYRSKLTEPFEPGQTLIVRGKTAEDSVRFTINLHHASADFSGNDVPLHISVRFDEGKIVFNTFSKGEWGKEERKSNPYKKGDDIDIRIRAHDSKFAIYADQKEIKEYEHRVPLSSISHFSIDGDVLVTHIHWGGKYYPVPYESGITGDGFNPGKTMLIFGTPEKKGKRFHINLLKKNGDIALHFNPRFDEKAIVRNSLIANEWGNEEREGKNPLEKGIGFDLKIVNEEYAFQIFINDDRFCSYAHRMEPHDIHGLQIGGDVEITGIQIF